MGDMSSPQTIPAQMAEPINDKASALGPAASAHKPTTTKDSAGRIPPPVRKSGQGQSGMAFADQLEKRHMPTSPTSENGPFGMAAMASALPHNGYQHPPPPGGHRHYNHQTSHPIMQHMPPNPYIGHHPGSIMVSGYYVQQPQMHQYYAANGHPSQHPMHGRANSGYYPVPFAMEHPQSPGYYPQAPQFPEPNHQRPDMMNRQYSQGHIQQEGRNQPRRPPHRTNKSFRDQTLPQVDTKRPQQNNSRGPPRKQHQSGHAIWIGNLPPQTELMRLVHHVCELAPDLQSLFLISKSNCAFANFRDETTSLEAQKAIHESKFQSVRLVCRLRKTNVEAIPDNQIVIAAGTSNPTSPTISDPHDGAKSPPSEGSDVFDIPNARTDGKHTNANAHKDRFFVLKSLTHGDLEQSVKTGIWATQSHNEQLLNNAFKTTDNVYLIFSANKSGEYFGFARMTSEINQNPEAAIQFAPQNQTPHESDQPQAVPIDAKNNIPKGRIIDDSARGTMLWEVEGLENGEVDDDSEVMGKEADDADEDMQTWGKPFHLQWLSVAPLPFYRTRGLRNPWNSNREVKIARDGTELEPSVGRRLIGLMNHNSSPGQTNHTSRQ